MDLRLGSLDLDLRLGLLVEDDDLTSAALHVPRWGA